MRMQNYAPSSETSELVLLQQFALLPTISQRSIFFVLCQGWPQYISSFTQCSSRSSPRSTLSQHFCTTSAHQEGFPLTHGVLGDCTCLCLLSEIKPWSYLCEMDYNNNSPACPKALTYTRFLNWDHPYLLPCCQTLAPITGDLQKTQSVRWYFVILCKKH